MGTSPRGSRPARHGGKIWRSFSITSGKPADGRAATSERSCWRRVESGPSRSDARSSAASAHSRGASTWCPTPRPRCSAPWVSARGSWSSPAPARSSSVAACVVGGRAREDSVPFWATRDRHSGSGGRGCGPRRAARTSVPSGACSPARTRSCGSRPWPRRSCAARGATRGRARSSPRRRGTWRAWPWTSRVACACHGPSS